MLLISTIARRCGTQHAAFAGSAAVVDLLLQHGAGDSAVNRCGRDASVPAVEEGHINVLKLLVARGVDVNTVDRYGKTLLIVAAERAHATTAELLITHSVPASAADTQGHTALHHVAFSSGSAAVTDLLLAYGTDVHATTDSDLAERH
jgi:uncharacterized protein